jgi:transcription elongation GreA/GreB family factor
VTDRVNIDKTRVLNVLRQRLEQDIAVAAEAQRRTQSGATHEESKPENDKDTRAIESSYLARGQAQRVVELTHHLATATALEPRTFGPETPIAVTACVTLNDGERTSSYFLSPVGGGLTLDVDGTKVHVLTPASPLGRALLGQTLGNDVEVRTPQGLKAYSVTSVC